MSVEVEHIDKAFKGNQALRQVGLTVEGGELFGVIGPDGAGKTTLFRIIASLILPDAGRCSVNGHDVVAEYRIVRRSIGYMPGRFSLYLDLSVEENLNFYAGVFGTTVRENYDLVREVYSRIAPFKKRIAGKLSGGMKQKLALSCALIHRPEVLILDEPTTGVDAVSRREFWDLLKSIQREGITILVSTPYMDEAVLCDRVALMHRGRILDVSDPETIRGDGYPIYAIRSRKGVFRYLDPVRNLEGCRSAWLFGDEIHVTLESEEFEATITGALRKEVDAEFEWVPTETSVEDRFMSLIRREYRQLNE